MSTSQQPLNILEHLHSLDFCEADSWELISLIRSLGNEITANHTEAEARKIHEWPEWLEKNGFRFELLKEFALRTEQFIINESTSSIPLSTQISELGMGASFPDLLDSLSLYHPELLDVFVQSLQQCQAQSQSVGLRAGGTSKAGRDAMITGAVITVGVAGVYFGHKYTRPTAVLNRRITRLEQELADNAREEAKDIQSNIIPDAKRHIPRDQWRSYFFSDSDKQETLLTLGNKTAEKANAIFLREASGMLKEQLAIGYAAHPEAPTRLATLEEQQFEYFYTKLRDSANSTLKLLYATKQLDPEWRKVKQRIENQDKYKNLTPEVQDALVKTGALPQTMEQEVQSSLMNPAKEALRRYLGDEINAALQNIDKYLEGRAENRLDQAVEAFEATEEEKIEMGAESMLRQTAEFDKIVDDQP